MTGPRRSQTHPRAAGKKQVRPRTKGCGRARLSGESCMVVRSCRSVSSQVCRSLKHRGVSSSRGESKLGRRERVRERRRNKGFKGVERKHRCRAVRRRRVKQRIVSNKVAKVARPDPVHPRAQIVMVRVRRGHC
eukprot:6213659-Pleurochrysis_carterae.AAC.3